LQTEALVSAIGCIGAGDFKTAIEALRAYKDSLFPFLEAERKKLAEQEKAQLKYWTEKMAFKVRPLWIAGNEKRLHSQMRKGMERTKQAEELRRKKRHTRI
jgi:hypothetical protein